MMTMIKWVGLVVLSGLWAFVIAPAIFHYHTYPYWIDLTVGGVLGLFFFVALDIIFAPKSK